MRKNNRIWNRSYPMEETGEPKLRIYQKFTWYLFLNDMIIFQKRSFSKMAFYFCVTGLSFTVTRDYLAEFDAILTLI